MSVLPQVHLALRRRRAQQSRLRHQPQGNDHHPHSVTSLLWFFETGAVLLNLRGALSNKQPNPEITLMVLLV